MPATTALVVEDGISDAAKVGDVADAADVGDAANRCGFAVGVVGVTTSTEDVRGRVNAEEIRGLVEAVAETEEEDDDDKEEEEALLVEVRSVPFLAL